MLLLLLFVLIFIAIILEKNGGLRWTRHHTYTPTITPKSESPANSGATEVPKQYSSPSGKSEHPYWSKHNKLYPGGSPTSQEWGEFKRTVRARDGGRCVQCGSTTLLHVDHITPLSKGGANAMGNLQTLCKKCHEIKTGRPLRDWREGNTGNKSGKSFSRRRGGQFRGW